ncbi:MAG: FixH family protein [Pyrinomonadaceae bacterium]
MFKAIAASIFFCVTIFAIACGGSSTSGGKTIKAGPAGNNLTATLASSDGVLRNGKQNFTLTFTDQSGKPVDVGSVALNFFMPAMGSMAAMNNPASFTTTNTPGVYAGKVDLEMAGEWQAQITYDGPAGKGKATITTTAQ